MTTLTHNNLENPQLGLFQNYGPEKSGDADDILKTMQNDQLSSLRNAIDDLKFLVNERQALNEQMFSDIDKIRMDINNFILESGNDVTAKDKLELRKKLIEIEEIKLQEKLNSWRDVAQLKKELRERIKEHEEKSNRLKVLDQIMEE
ncbi:MAG: hypothetical protein U9Q69_01285 [Nanoarchaeota archaeon]|nr:hypothetical protein [Nanoarchaeota archaeon]